MYNVFLMIHKNVMCFKLFGWVSQDQNYKNLIAKQLNPRGSHQHMRNDGCRMNMQARVQD